MRNFFYRKCGRCGGTGSVSGDVPEDPCTQCDGEGYYSSTYLKPSVVFAYEISDALDIGEYSALSEGNKSALHIILSLGFVDLDEGTSSRAALWAMFDSESTTRANLLTLLDES